MHKPVSKMGLSAIRRNLKRFKTHLKYVMKTYPDGNHRFDTDRIKELEKELAKREASIRKRP